jgi:lipopolysaccharide/colanic/teichoic acid biosynthesis glycosyltransferase
MNPVLDQRTRGQNSLTHATVLSCPQAAMPVSLGVHGSDSSASRAACRLLNIIIAVILLIVCAPLFLLIAALVRLSSPGPIIFTQTRVGLDRRSPGSSGFESRRKVNYGGRLFRIYKFRTMHANPDAHLQVWANPADQRVTTIGKYLRKYRLDELPQLLNVLKGEMNVVGPRPEQPNIFLSLNEQITDYAHRQRVLPGITGWAQVNHPYDQSVDDVRRKLAFDLAYIERQTLAQDLKILALTVPVVLFRRGGW